MSSSWTHELIRYLPNTMVVLRSDACFHESVDIFNHAIISPAHAIVRVTSASDVSTVVLFAKSHGLSISVKAGGHNTAGWAVQGDIVIDLCSLNNVDLHLPEESTGRIALGSLRNASYKGKGKKRGESEAFGLYGANVNGSESSSMNGKNKKCSEGDRVCSLMNGGESISGGDKSQEQLSRSASTSSSSTPSQGQSGFNGDNQSETTGPSTTSGSNPAERFAATRNEKGKERAITNGMSSTTTGSGMNEDSLSEGTRNWLAEQSHVPSWATSYQPRRQFNSSSSLLSTSPGSMPNGFPSISSNGFSFNPSTLASSPSSHSSNPSLSSSGFVFNPAALASRSTLASTISSQSSIPISSASSSRVSATVSPIILGPTSTTSPSSATSSSNSSSFPLASTTIPRTTPFSLPTSTTSTGSSSFAAGGPGSTTSNTSLNSTSLPYALVTICAGAKSHEIDAVTGTMNYYCPQAAYPVGCAIFASGGFGFMSRLNGLSMDNVVEVEMVLADGRIVYLNEPSEEEQQEGRPLTEEEIEQRDLWWAFRGAGTTLGIVTRLRAKAYKVGLVFSGNLIYPFNVATTPSLIKYWRDCCVDAPRELYCNLILTAGPDANSHVVVIQICYLGSRGEGEKFLQSLMSWEGERCLLKDVETRTFMEQQDSVKQVLGVQAGSRWCIRANLMNSLPDDAIDSSVLAFRTIPEKSAWLFEIAGGAIADVKPDSSCFPSSHRSAPFQVAAIHQWKLREQDNIWTHAAKDWINNVIGPYSPGGSFPCFLENREGVESVRKVFGETNWNRLVEVKMKFDPEHIFRHTFWPESLEEEGVGEQEGEGVVVHS